MADLFQLNSSVLSVALDTRVGHLRNYEARYGGNLFRPLYTAPWVNNDAINKLVDDPPVEKYLSGDFFCAPFAFGDVELSPLHGWSANSKWILNEQTSAYEATFELQKLVLGAQIQKTLRCSNDAPLLYQIHRFKGGLGSLPVSHHVMTQMQDGGFISNSPKCIALTPDAPINEGLNHLTYPASSNDLTAFPAGNSTADLTHFPLTRKHDDFITLVEMARNSLGWTAVLRKVENDILFVLKDPSVMPVTMQWFYNDEISEQQTYGIHKGVLGVEDGCSGIHSGHRASLEPSTLTKLGVPTNIKLGNNKTPEIRHVIGVIRRPKGWNVVSNINIISDELVITGPGEEAISLPFDAGFYNFD
jgi:hypothetical protein